METDKKTKTINIIKAAVLFIFFAISLALSFWIADSSSVLFGSVLDKYLNLNNVILYMAAAILNMIIAASFLVLFIIRIIKLIRHKSVEQKKASTIVISIFLVVNIIFLILMVYFQAHESSTVNCIPDSVTSYIDINKAFPDSPQDSDYNEQTDFRKITSEIPVNYKVEQRNSEYYVQTSCIEITDEALLLKYYDEQKELFSVNNISEFSASQLEAISADKGCYWQENDVTFNFLVLKGDKIFNVCLSGDNIEVNDRIIAQLAAL